MTREEIIRQAREHLTREHDHFVNALFYGTATTRAQQMKTVTGWDETISEETHGQKEKETLPSLTKGRRPAGSDANTDG